MSDGNVSIIDVAAAAGVSKSTASRALLGAGDVSEKTRLRVQQIADDIGYVKDFRAHALKSSMTRTVAIYVRSVQLSYYGELIAAVQARLEAADYSLAVTSAGSTDARPLDTLLALRPAAAVIASGRVPLRRFSEYGRIPIVLAGSDAGATTLSSVSDDGSGSEVLADRIIKAGHRRVAVLDVRPGRSRTLAPRAARMRAALEARGARVRPIALAEADDVPVDEQLRRAVDEVTAIMCPNDPTLIATWEKLTAWGLRVPDDVSLTGYDGVGMLASPAIGLTTWAQPVDEIGRRVAEELLRRLEDPDASPAHISLPGTLVVGRTLGAPRPL